MAIIKCKMCGGDLILTQGQSVAECEFCGSRQTVPTADNEKKLTMFVRANRLRATCEFDKSAGIYESIVADFPEEAEAYWGLVLCKYGIEYVDDPGTGKKIPTCHRSSFESVMDDSNLELALENTDALARRVYREEAKKIEEIRKGIIAVSSNEEPYDIFICYKETDEDGDRTLDSVLAQDIYDALTDKGHRTFFARITLEDKLGQEYEPYIFAALNSAKVMLAVGTDYECYNAVWVKNEWSRFLKLMEKDQSKHLIPCYKGIDAYDMPKEFARLQAQDLGKMGAIQDILRGVEKLLPRQHKKEVVVQNTVSQQNETLENFLKRGQFALEDGRWDEAKTFFDKVLNIDAESGLAYLGLELAEKKCYTPVLLGRQYPFYFIDHRHPEESKLLKRARQFADAITKEKLAAFDVALKEKLTELAKVEQQEVYNAAKQAMKDAKTEKDFLAAANQFHSVTGYEDADEYAQKCEGEVAGIRRRKKEKMQFLAPKREKSTKASTLMYVDDDTSLVVKLDGTVAELDHQRKVTHNLHDWSDIVAVCSHSSVSYIGLKSNGKVVAAGDDRCGRNISDWENIVAIATGDHHTVGLKADGTVVSTGLNPYGEGNVSEWKHIISISAGQWHTVALKNDGNVVAVGMNDYGECDVDDWENIVAIATGDHHTVGLKADGTVVATGLNEFGECNVSDWEDIVAISAGQWITAGLKADGTVVRVGDNSDGRFDQVAGWKNILAIFTGSCLMMGVQTDGTVVAAGDNLDHPCDLDGWKLFDDIENLEQERTAARILRDQEIKKAELLKEQQRKENEERESRRRAGLCQHCGGELKGFFSKKCVSCEKPKDY